MTSGERGTASHPFVKPVLAHAPPRTAWPALAFMVLLVMAAGAWVATIPDLTGLPADRPAARAAEARLPELLVAIAEALQQAALVDLESDEGVRLLTVSMGRLRIAFDALARSKQLPEIPASNLREALAAAEASGVRLLELERPLRARETDFAVIRVRLERIVVAADKFLARRVQQRGNDGGDRRPAVEQLALAHSMLARLTELELDDDRSLAATDRFGRDAMALGGLNVELQSEPRGTKQARVRDEEALQLLTAIGEEFRAIAGSLDVLLESVTVAASVRQRRLDLLAKLGRLLEAARAVPVPAIALPRARPEPDGVMLSGPVALAIAAGTVLAGVLLVLVSFARQRQVARHARAQAAAIEELEDAIDGSRQLERLIAERLSDLSESGVSRNGAIRQQADGVPALEDPMGLIDSLERLESRWLGLRERVGLLADASADAREVTFSALDNADRNSLKLQEASRATYGVAASVEAVAGEAERWDHSARDATDLAGGLLTEVGMLTKATRQASEQAGRGAALVTTLSQAGVELGELGQSVLELEELARMLSMNAAIHSAGELDPSRVAELAEEAERLSQRVQEASARMLTLSKTLLERLDDAHEKLEALEQLAQDAEARTRSVAELMTTFQQLQDRQASLASGWQRVFHEHTAGVTDVVRAMRQLHELNRGLTNELREALRIGQAAADATAALGFEAGRPTQRPLITLETSQRRSRPTARPLAAEDDAVSDGGAASRVVDSEAAPCRPAERDEDGKEDGR